MITFLLLSVIGILFGIATALTILVLKLCGFVLRLILIPVVWAALAVIMLFAIMG